METSKVKAQFLNQYAGIGLNMQCIAKTFTLPDRVLNGVLLNDKKERVLYLSLLGHSDFYDIDEWILPLRSIEQLTDEEIANIADMYGWANKDVTKERRDSRLLQFKVDLPCICRPGYGHQHRGFVFDYLRSLSVLIPFTFINEQGKPETYSPEKLIELGWAKIK